MGICSAREISQITKLYDLPSAKTQQMTPFQGTLSKAIRQLLNYDAFIFPSTVPHDTKITRTPIAQFTDNNLMLHVTSIYVLLTSPDVICLPEKKRNCISLKCTCEKRVFIPSQIEYVQLAIFSPKYKKTWEQIQFHCRDMCSFMFSILCSYSTSHLLRTFTFESCTLRCDFFSFFNKKKRIS